MELAGALALDLIFPRTCPLCGEVLPFAAPWRREEAQAAFWEALRQEGKQPAPHLAESAKRLSDFYICPACEEKLPYLLNWTDFSGGLNGVDCAEGSDTSRGWKHLNHSDLSGCSEGLWHSDALRSAKAFSKHEFACIPKLSLQVLPQQPVCEKCGRPLTKPQREGEADGDAGAAGFTGQAKAPGEVAVQLSAQSLTQAPEPQLCSGCRKHVRLFRRCFCLFPYDGTLRKALAGIKYHHERQAMEALGELTAFRLGPLLLDLQPAVLVPVPVHRKRLRERGYNQAEVLCRILAKRTGLPMAEKLLLREKNTKAQKELGAVGRMKNLQNAFRPAKRCRGPKRALLVDDIYTTGATLEACTESLFEAGVEEVYGLCLCGTAEQAV